MQEIALVLSGVDPLEQHGFPVERCRPGIVSRGKELAAEALRVIAEYAKLDFPVTEHVGVGCAPGGILLEKVPEYAVPVLAGEIRVVQRNVELLTNSAGILEVRRGVAVAVVVLPVGHMQCVHVGTGVLE